MGKVVVVNLD